ncbi:reverse transcriptase domain-containing protein [Citrus sinensis]|nr:reverse transcriptase domain-containing protein [Citrus sinensis]
MPVVYERLPDFCYCCGIIEHQYKKCGKYQDQQREDLPYGSWMKAITVGGFTKRNQNKERWNYGVNRMKNHKTPTGLGTVGTGRSGSHESKQYGDISGGWWSAPPKAMNILSWNVRGLGNPRAFQALRKILQLHGAQLVFLSETKSGGNDRNVNLINDFREVLRDCGLKDVGYQGYAFTWNNGRYGQGFVEERLDRFVCNKAWSDRFVDCEASNLDTWTLDHCPMLMAVQERSGGMNLSVQSFRKATKDSMVRLMGWSKMEFRKRDKKLEKLKNQLRGLKQRMVQYENGEEIWKVEKQIQNILMDEEIYWKQRSRAYWLKEGDKNTKFFHGKALAKRKKNRIWGIEDKFGRWIEKPKEVEHEFCNYFTNLFTSTQLRQEQIVAALKGITPRVSASMNESLEEPFTAEEVLEDLSQMCPTKAPGLDGLPAVFYQKHWHTVKEGVLTTCLHILNSQGTIAPLNHTYIALIPKIGKPRKVTNFRPISLCNVIYRIVAKSAANRFKQILHKIISPSQSAFILNRLITGNIIVGYECLHKIRHCKGKRNGLIALKLDVSKACDRLEWNGISLSKL